MHLREAQNRNSTPHRGKASVAARYPQPVSHHRDKELSNSLYTGAAESVAAHANAAFATAAGKFAVRANGQRFKQLYTPEERIRRDATRWTLVQGILAPIQFAAFLISLALVVRYLAWGEGFSAATASIVIKTLLLYAIMITGSLWEREVFGRYLFAPAFFWEDVFSFLVLALHTAYLFALFSGLGDPRQQMLLALAAYASYFINASQFVLKLRAARRDERVAASAAPSISGGRA